MMIVFRIYHTHPTNRTVASSTTAMYNNQSNEEFQDKITSSCAWRMNVYIEKPIEKLYMINVIGLHMLKQNNMHTSNDVFFGSTCPVIKIKVMLNDRI